jgi:hypothetical protein
MCAAKLVDVGGVTAAARKRGQPSLANVLDAKGVWGRHPTADFVTLVAQFISTVASSTVDWLACHVDVPMAGDVGNLSRHYGTGTASLQHVPKPPMGRGCTQANVGEWFPEVDWIAYLLHLAHDRVRGQLCSLRVRLLPATAWDEPRTTFNFNVTKAQLQHMMDVLVSGKAINWDGLLAGDKGYPWLSPLALGVGPQRAPILSVCVVCDASVQDGHPWVSAHCGHAYHSVCFWHWTAVTGYRDCRRCHRLFFPADFVLRTPTHSADVASVAEGLAKLCLNSAVCKAVEPLSGASPDAADHQGIMPPAWMSEDSADCKPVDPRAEHHGDSEHRKPVDPCAEPFEVSAKPCLGFADCKAVQPSGDPRHCNLFKPCTDARASSAEPGGVPTHV